MGDYDAAPDGPEDPEEEAALKFKSVGDREMDEDWMKSSPSVVCVQRAESGARKWKMADGADDVGSARPPNDCEVDEVLNHMELHRDMLAKGLVRAWITSMRDRMFLLAMSGWV